MVDLQLSFKGMDELNGSHSLLQIDLINKILNACMPKLLESSDESNKILDQIHHYLFKQKRLKSIPLKRKVTDELYSTLHELKSMMKQNRSINLISWSLEEHKNQFEDWFKEEMDLDVLGDNLSD